jgi:hypothetical protein
MRRGSWFIALLISLSCLGASQHAQTANAFRPGGRVLLDAHNCYPYGEWWSDRIDRALSNGIPLAIEQDLAWYKDPRTNRAWSVLSHSPAATGSEPTLKEYFFERIRPIVESALKDSDRSSWPLITLNLDFKTEEPEHLRAIRSLLREYQDWLTTAPRSQDIRVMAALNVKPLLVLTGESDAQKKVFHDEVSVGASLLVFGATRTHNEDPTAPATSLAPEPADNYHRWWNNPWRVIEPAGQPAASEWNGEKEQRLRNLVRYAHDRGYWIRFYTLDGESSADESSHGWFHSYNFGSLDAARLRWQAAIRAGVDFVAVDQYENFASELNGSVSRSARTLIISGSLTRDDYERLLERSFDVLPGTRSLRIELAYTGTDRGTVIDLGLRGPAGFRGWSGGGPQKIVVGPTFTSYGYLPGPIEAGSWAVILGVPNIRGGSTDTYSISIEQLDREEPSFPVIRHEAAWFTGDFHSHSGHSDGHAEVLGGTQTKIPPHRVFEAARRVGLDFVTLTDHNTTSHWTEVERLQSYYNNMLLLHAREVTTYNGHLNAFGEREFTDFRVTTDRPLEVILDELTSRGVFISINHPALPDDESCMGCGWTSGAKPEVMRRVNGIEIVNGDRAEGPLSGWAIWAKMLNAGYHLTAIGGSDEHTADETRDRSIGTPATVVYADELSEPALLDGLRKGRAYVRTRGPQGPTLQFEASSENLTWRVGDTVPKAVTAFTLSASASRATNQQLQWVRNGEIISTSRVVGEQPVTLEVKTQRGEWFSVIIRDENGPTLFSNAIYIEP